MYEFQKKKERELCNGALNAISHLENYPTFFSNFKMVFRTLVSGSNSPGSSPGRRHCVVFLGKTLNSHSASLHPGV